jgi:hypothetical protein
MIGNRLEENIMKKKKSKSEKETPKKPMIISKPVEEVQFNFGGLSDRDLKKNLGCG